MNIERFGDDALLLQITDAVQDSAVPLIHAIIERLNDSSIFDEIVAGYDSVFVQYDPLRLSHKAAHEALSLAAANARPAPQVTAVIIDVPVCYGGVYGPDMKAASKALSLSQDEIIAIHSAQPYRVCMMGFIPGFTFLSAADDRLHMPRHTKPRARVAAGSVGIAGWQTGIYALDSPGGWQILGRTPLPLFSPDKANPFRLKAGDHIRFKPITATEFEAL